MSRRTGAFFLVPLVGAMVFALATLEERAWGQWMAAIDLVTGITVLTGPIVAACAGHLTWTQSRLDPLLSTTPRGWLIPLRCALQAWTWGVIAFGVSVLTIVVLTVIRPHGGPSPWWAAAIALPVLGFAALFGALATRVLPSRLTVVVVGPLLFLLGAFGPSSYAGLLRHGPSTGSLAGLEIDPAFWLLQGAGLVALCTLVIGALVALGRASLAPRRLAGPAVLGVLALGVLVVTGTAVDHTDRQRLRLSGERPEVCQGSGPRICVSGSSLGSYAVSARPFRRAVRALAAIDVRVPDRYEEVLPGYDPAESAGQILVGPDAADLRAGARSAATPAGCPQWRDPRVPPEKALQARELIVDWVRVREGERVASFSAQSDRWLRTAASPEAQAWVRTTFAQFASCDLSKIRMPWTAPRAP